MARKLQNLEEIVILGKIEKIDGLISVSKNNEELIEKYPIISIEDALAEEILARNTYKKVSKILKGGETRKESSSIGVSSIEESDANVLIHDCARPLVSQKIITDCIKALETYQAVNVAIPATDTTIEVENNLIKKKERGYER